LSCTGLRIISLLHFDFCFVLKIAHLQPGASIDRRGRNNDYIAVLLNKLDYERAFPWKRSGGVSGPEKSSAGWWLISQTNRTLNC
jgi:hypothetical protein